MVDGFFDWVRSERENYREGWVSCTVDSPSMFSSRSKVYISVPGSKTSAVVLFSVFNWDLRSSVRNIEFHWRLHSQTGQQDGGICVATLSAKVYIVVISEEQRAARELKHADTSDRM